MRHCTLLVLATLLLCTANAAENRLRNGSFEGSTAYWITDGIPTIGDSPSGQWQLHFADKGDLRSASFALQPGDKVTMGISARARSDQKTLFGFSLCPSNREAAQAAKLVWNAKTGYSASLTQEWQHFTWTWTVPNVDDKSAFAGSNNGWWNRRSWVIVGSVNQTCDVDGFSLTVGENPNKEIFSPYSTPEVCVQIADLPGYTTAANLVTTDTITAQAALFNPTASAQTVKIAWEMRDYADTISLKSFPTQEVMIAANSTVMHEQRFPVSAQGLVLIRATITDTHGTRLASSDHPVTRLAFPKSATGLDLRERFGASLRGGPLEAAAQQIGLRWTRWHPPLNWAEIQPTSGDDWVFPDVIIDRLRERGIAVNAVLYALPKWAKGDDRNLPKDMSWPADDPRWGDFTIVTSWDTFVTKTVAHFAGRVDTWEIANEPDIHDQWKSDIYTAFTKRTYRLVKQANPQAKVLVNVTWPGASWWTRDFIKRGGLAAFDVHSFHNYTAGQICGPGDIRDLSTLFQSFGGKESKREIWFNEGWTYVPTSIDYPSLPIVDVPPATVAHNIVRSAVELTSAGMQKLICFHIGYDHHGRSWWDWVGSGTEWWDDHGNPTVAVSAWNTLCHHLGLSEPVAIVHADGAVIHVFQDMRNKRGVAVAWATGPTVSLPIAGKTGERWDCMGRGETLRQEKQVLNLSLPANGVPIFFIIDQLDGARLAALLQTLVQVDARLVAGAIPAPERVIGDEVNGTAGNPVLLAQQPTWRLARVWPADPHGASNYVDLRWSGTQWFDPEHSHGGQPSIAIADHAIELSARSRWGGDQAADKLPALIFMPPHPGTWQVSATVQANIWAGNSSVTLTVLAINRAADRTRVLNTLTITESRKDQVLDTTVVLEAGEELAWVPGFNGANTAAGVRVSGLIMTPVP